MATHSCVLAWRIPWTEQPSRLQPMESQRVGHDLVIKQQSQQILAPLLIPRLQKYDMSLYSHFTKYIFLSSNLSFPLT